MTDVEVLPTESWDFHEFSPLWQRYQRLSFRFLVKSFTQYQPVEIFESRLTEGVRDCERRWKLIDAALRGCEAGTLLDLGCAEGYFVRKAVREKSWIGFGVDGDIRRITVAQSAAMLERLEGISFSYGRLSPQFVRKLPQYDVVLLLSILHHIMLKRGLGYARDLMESIRSRTRQRLIIEMGQTDEQSPEWSDRLPAMIPDPARWIRNFLQECGFMDVEVIGDSDGYHGRGRRILFMARP